MKTGFNLKFPVSVKKNFRQITLGLLIFTFYFQDFAAAQKLDECGILKSILSNDLSRRTFKFDRHPDLPITFSDRTHKFSRCVIDSVYARRVEILDDTTTSLTQPYNPQYIVLYRIVNKRGKYDLIIGQNWNGAFGHIYFTRRKGKIRITKFYVGYI